MSAVSAKPLEAVYAEKLDKIFQKKDSLLEYNPGKCVLPALFGDVAQKVLDADVREDDLWFISFPRTGSTWCMEMVWLIRHDLDFNAAQKQLLQIRNPLIELSGIYEAEWCKAVLKTDSGDFLEFTKNLPSPRIIRSHLPWCLLPTQLKKLKPKLIYIFRDPKDVCVSLFHYLQLLHNLSTNFEEFAELFLAGQVPYGSYFDHVAGFWNLRNEENVLFLTYEEMKRDLRKTAEKVAGFLEKEIPEKEMDRLMEHLSFQKMKQNPTCNLDTIVKAVGGEEGTFMRKGQTGDWKNYFSKELAGKFDEVFRRSVPDFKFE